MFSFPVGFNKKANGPAIANLVHWVSADALSTITKDGSNNVSVWADQSGHNTNWGTPAGSGTIIWVANQINGLPVIRSSGGASNAPYLQQTRFLTDSTNSPAEVFVVLKTNVTGNTDYSWAGFSTNTFPNQYPWSTGDIYDNFGSSRQSGTPQDGGGEVVCKAYHIFNISSGGSSGLFVMRHHGKQFYSGGPFNNTWNATFRLFAAADVIGNAGFQGDIAEILIYNSVLSSTDRTTTYSYLSVKYNIT